VAANRRTPVPLNVPEAFLTIPYNPDRHPQAAEFDILQGANCQLFAYALLKHFGVSVPPFRSSELWEDVDHTDVVNELAPLDLLLFNDSNNSWGAHVAVSLGEDVVIHLSRQIGRPAICSFSEMVSNPKYNVFIGAKRVRSANHPPRPARGSARG
jgi:lipoprotein Spr